MSRVSHIRFHMSDWRSGCIGLDLEEEGLFIRICAYQWETGRRLPIDDRDAATCVMLDIRMYRRIRTRLQSKGKLNASPEGYYVERAEREYRLATEGMARSQKAQPEDVGSTRHSDDQKHQNGGASEQGRQPAGAAVLIDVLAMSETSQTEVAEKSQRSRPELCQKPQQNQRLLIEPYPEPEPEKEKKVHRASARDGLCRQAFDAYNSAAERLGLPVASRLTDGRLKHINARLSEYGIDGWNRALANLAASPFLLGKNDRRFRADIDFVCRAEKFTRLHDGGYGSKTAAAAPKPTPETPLNAEDAALLEARRRARERVERERAAAQATPPPPVRDASPADELFDA